MAVFWHTEVNRKTEICMFLHPREPIWEPAGTPWEPSWEARVRHKCGPGHRLDVANGASKASPMTGFCGAQDQNPAGQGQDSGIGPLQSTV